MRTRKTKDKSLSIWWAFIPYICVNCKTWGVTESGSPRKHEMSRYVEEKQCSQTWFGYCNSSCNLNYNIGTIQWEYRQKIIFLCLTFHLCAMSFHPHWGLNADQLLLQLYGGQKHGITDPFLTSVNLYWLSCHASRVTSKSWDKFQCKPIKCP